MQIRFPFVKIAVLFTIGILLRQWAAVPFWVFIAIAVLVLSIQFIIKKRSTLNPIGAESSQHFYQNSKTETKSFLHQNSVTPQSNKKPAGILNSLFLSLLIIFCGNQAAVISLENISYIPEGIYKQDNFTAYGEVIKVSLPNNKGFTFNLKCDSVEFNGSKIITQAEVIVNVKRENLGSDFISLYKDITPGDYIRTTGFYLKGREQRNPGEFDYNKFLRNKGISGIISVLSSHDVLVLKHSRGNVESLFRSIRESISRKLNSLHDYETASLLRGLLLADRSDIDEDIRTDFINSGVAHVLAVSGLHVSFIVMIIIFLCGRFDLRFRVIIITVGILFYVLLTGAPASVVRAGIMSVILVIAFFSNRETNLLNAIAISALIILAFSPEQIYDPGFQLSYAAVISLAVLYPVFIGMDIVKNMQSRNLQRLILFILLSFCAQIGTLPFVLLYFGKISLTSLFANMLVIPLSGIILGNGIFTVVLSYLYLPFAIYPALTSALMVKVLYLITHVFGGEYSFIPVHGFNMVSFLFFYLFLGIFFYWLPSFRTFRNRMTLGLLVLVNLFLVVSLNSSKMKNKGDLQLIAIDVGQGDAFLMKFPNGQFGLIDAGEANLKYDNGEKVVLPLIDYFSIPCIDYAFISHMDKDHYSGILSLIRNGKIKKIYKPAPGINDSLSLRFERFCNENKVPIQYYSKTKLSIGNTRIYVLNDKSFPNNNDNSGILKIQYGNTSFLFTGDNSIKGEKHYLEYGSFLGSTVLKVAHHGSKTSSSGFFIQTVNPQYSIISAGIKNRYKHPDSEVLDRLRDIKTGILRTDSRGAVWLKSDGESVTIINWK